MKVLMIDNYDSFVYNIVHYLRELGAEVDIFKNDQIALDDVDSYNKIVLSPGPGIPSEAGVMLELIKRYASTKSILGVCLGHQAIGEAFGGELTNLTKVYHGVESEISKIVEDPIFEGLGDRLTVGRYHSWVVSGDNLPESLEITAIDDESGQVMALRHREYDVRGVQFHPESVLTPEGKRMIKNWLSL
ncbi:MAG: aminodeoxychorismate/anthranilate synthase component II [Rikenellaceae bacterium]